MIETHFVSFFILLLTAVFFSTIFTRFHLSWVVALIVGGVAIGPFGLDIFQADSTLLFMADIGLIFLMFMAGLEMKSGNIKGNLKNISVLALINGSIPFITGLVVGHFLGLSTTETLVIAIAFISSSVAVIVPSLTANNLTGTKLGEAILGSTMIQDVTSLILLSVLFQSADNVAHLPLPIFYILLALSLIVIRKILIFIEKYLSEREGSFNHEFRVTIAVLIGTVALFEILGLHSIIAGFFAGFVLSDTIKHDALKEKLHAIGYGLFIPIFFVMVGVQTDLSVFGGDNSVIKLMLIIVISSMLSKTIGGYIGSRLAKFTPTESRLIAVSSIPQLSTTLAVAFTASSLGLISTNLLTSLIALSVITTIVAPTLIRFILVDKSEEKVYASEHQIKLPK